MEWNILAGRPVYLQLIEQMEMAIVTGEYRAGQRLPGVRELAAEATVNPNTMQRALQELETRGLLATQRTAGRTVTADETALSELRAKKATAFTQQYWQQMQRLGCSRSEVLSLLQVEAAKSQ